MVENPLAMQETWVQSLSREDPLEKEVATHCSILAWRIPWAEEPGGLHTGQGLAEPDMTERLTRLGNCTVQVSPCRLPGNRGGPPWGCRNTPVRSSAYGSPRGPVSRGPKSSRSCGKEFRSPFTHPVETLPATDPGSIPGSGRFPGEGHGNPLQYSCLETSMDSGARWAIVRGVAKSWTRLSN